MPVPAKQEGEQMPQGLKGLDPQVLQQLAEAYLAKQEGPGSIVSDFEPDVSPLDPSLEKYVEWASQQVASAHRDENGRITDKRTARLEKDLTKMGRGAVGMHKGNLDSVEKNEKEKKRYERAKKKYEKKLGNVELVDVVGAAYEVMEAMGRGSQLIRVCDRLFRSDDRPDELLLQVIGSLGGCDPEKIVAKATSGSFETLTTLIAPVLAFTAAEEQLLKKTKRKLGNGREIRVLIEGVLGVDARSQEKEKREREEQLRRFLQHHSPEVQEEVRKRLDERPIETALRYLAGKVKKHGGFDTSLTKVDGAQAIINRFSSDPNFPWEGSAAQLVTAVEAYRKRKEQRGDGNKEVKKVYRQACGIERKLLEEEKGRLRESRDFQRQVFEAAKQSKRPAGDLLWDLALGKPAQEVFGDRAVNGEISWQALAGSCLKALMAERLEDDDFRSTVEHLVIDPYKALIFPCRRNQVLSGRLEKTLDITVGDVLSPNRVKFLLTLGRTRSIDEAIATMEGWDAVGERLDLLRYGEKKGWSAEIEEAFGRTFPRDARTKDEGLARAVVEAMAVFFRRAEQTNERERERLMLYDLLFADEGLRQEFVNMMGEIDTSSLNADQKTALLTLIAGGFSETYRRDDSGIEPHYGQIMIKHGTPLLVTAARDRKEGDRGKNEQAKLAENILKGAVKYSSWEVAEEVLKGFASSMAATPLELGEYTGLFYDVWEKLLQKDETVPAEVRREAKWQLAFYLANLAEGITPNVLPLIETWTAQAKGKEQLEDLDSEKYARESRKSILQSIIDLEGLVGGGATLLPNPLVVDTLSLNPVPSEFRLEALQNGGKERPHFKPEVAYLGLGGEFASYGKQEPTVELVAVVLAANIANSALTILRAQKRAEQDTAVETENARRGMGWTTAIQSTSRGDMIVEQTFTDPSADRRDDGRDAIAGREERRQSLMVAQPELRERQIRTRVLTRQELEVGRYLAALMEKAGMSGRLVSDPEDPEASLGIVSRFALGFGYQSEKYGISREALERIGGRWLEGVLARQVGPDGRGNNWGEYAIENLKSPSLSKTIEDAEKIKKTRKKIEAGWSPGEAVRSVWGTEGVKQLEAGE